MANFFYSYREFVIIIIIIIIWHTSRQRPFVTIRRVS